MDIKDIMASWVRDARKQAGLSGEELGAKLALELKTARGHTKGNISHWEKGRHEPSLQQLVAISKITGVPLPAEIVSKFRVDPVRNEYRDGDLKIPASYGRRATDVPGSMAVRAINDEESNGKVARIRKVKLRLSAGIVGFAVDPDTEDGNPIYFRQDWLAHHGYKPENLVAIHVHGQSMEPGLYDGDTVIINTADTTPRDGEVFAVNYEGEAVIKRMVRDAGIWWLSSDNPDQRRFPRKQCLGDACIIIGRAIHKQSMRL